MRVNCSADGDNLHFSWSSEFNALPQLENGTSTVILEQDHQGKVTCHVENHVSHDHNTVELHQCPARVSSVKLSYSCLFLKVRKVYCSADGDNLHFSWTSGSITRLEEDNRTLVLDKKHNENVTCHVDNHISRDHNSIELLKCTDLILLILSSVCGILTVLVVLAFCVYKKRQGLRRKAPSQDDKELVYAEVSHTAMNRTKTRPTPVQYEGVEYGTVVTSNQKKKEDEVQYGELVFNTPAQKKSKVSKVQEECVYSGVQHSQ
ncbi:uncharacterized protein LOC131371112 [Hemibagrus wyckioides]|uniref:uncharacterized protein LOC131371112 n=1 Tax=Hemibagrus wyckioides TaxID=337641 RepID=UPI00266DA007|nr:uncharacterized protein LOC131371112 [Hemibagrus wyckioides]